MHHQYFCIYSMPLPLTVCPSPFKSIQDIENDQYRRCWKREYSNIEFNISKREITVNTASSSTFSSFLSASVTGLQSPSCQACLQPTQYCVLQLPQEVRRRLRGAGGLGWLLRNIRWYHLKQSTSNQHVTYRTLYNLK